MTRLTQTNMINVQYLTPHSLKQLAALAQLPTAIASAQLLALRIDELARQSEFVTRDAREAAVQAAAQHARELEDMQQAHSLEVARLHQQIEVGCESFCRHSKVQDAVCGASFCMNLRHSVPVQHCFL